MVDRGGSADGISHQLPPQPRRAESGGSGTAPGTQVGIAAHAPLLVQGRRQQSAAAAEDGKGDLLLQPPRDTPNVRTPGLQDARHRREARHVRVHAGMVRTRIANEGSPLLPLKGCTAPWQEGNPRDAPHRQANKSHCTPRRRDDGDPQQVHQQTQTQITNTTMTITGTIKQILPEQSGVSKAGKNWRRRDQILDITENPQYPKLLCFTLMNDRIDAAGIAEGQRVTIDCDIDSREYNGR
ncbi:MAG TPA: hypothetical protein DC009_07525, partial [Porphyromonadaceae bacterium]|nr:hypothetical protein [Porphyromonadaceae bacterium]